MATTPPGTSARSVTSRRPPVASLLTPSASTTTTSAGLTAAWTPASNDCTTPPDANALGGPAPYWHSWTFDKVGNRQTETRHNAGGANTSTYTYPNAGQSRPHAVSKVSNGTTENAYAYDEMGNLTKRTLGGVTEIFSWDAEGNLATVTENGRTTAFV